MPFRKDHVRRILADAVSDREEYLDAVAGDARQEAVTRDDLARLRALEARYDSGRRVRIDASDHATLRLACRCALIWREGFLDSVSGTGDLALMERTRRQIRVAKAVMAEAGGVTEDQAFAGARALTLAEMMREPVFPGTRVEVRREGNRETRSVTERGVPLGRIETDADGTVRVTLADGKIVNEPFDDAFAAQEWLLERFSRNRLVGGGRGEAPTA